MKGKNYREFFAEKLKDPKFKKEWDALEAEYNEIKIKFRAEIEQEKRAAETQNNIAG